MEGWTTYRPGLVPGPAATVEPQPNGFVSVSVGEVLDEFPDRDFDSQFLAQFAHEALFKRLAGFALAAREFPESALMGLRMTLREQKLALPKYQTGSNFNHRGWLLAHLSSSPSSS